MADTLGRCPPPPPVKRQKTDYCQPVPFRIVPKSKPAETFHSPEFLQSHSTKKTPTNTPSQNSLNDNHISSKNQTLPTESNIHSYLQSNSTIDKSIPNSIIFHNNSGNIIINHHIHYHWRTSTQSTMFSFHTSVLFKLFLGSIFL